MCISINVRHWANNNSQIIGFTSSMLDSRYAESSQAWGWGGFPAISDQDYLETIAIPRTLAYLSPKFQSIYGRPMMRADICGQEGYKTPEQMAAAAAAKAAEAAAAAADQTVADRPGTPDPNALLDTLKDIAGDVFKDSEGHLLGGAEQRISILKNILIVIIVVIIGYMLMKR